VDPALAAGSRYLVARRAVGCTDCRREGDEAAHDCVQLIVGSYLSADRGSQGTGFASESFG
jgi:hypothetical protein